LGRDKCHGTTARVPLALAVINNNCGNSGAKSARVDSPSKETAVCWRRGDHKQIEQFITREMATNGGSWSHKARVTGHYLADEIRRNLK
jgi:hypothetical protein